MIHALPTGSIMLIWVGVCISLINYWRLLGCEIIGWFWTGDRYFKWVYHISSSNGLLEGGINSAVGGLSSQVGIVIMNATSFYAGSGRYWNPSSGRS